MSLLSSLLFTTFLASSSLASPPLWNSMDVDKLDWWQSAVIYQIFPQSFKDSDSDGIGDIRGIINSLLYIKDLGVDAVWISPLYESPMVDSGYDVSNFTKIDPRYGTMADFKEMVEEMKKLNIKLIMDFEPNHSSDLHEWFIKSIGNEPEYLDYYVWAPPKFDVNQNRKPPNNWLSVFGGSAWTYVDKREQYYLHQFSKNQPDFNLRNKNLVKKLGDVLEFWLKLGVDGFRMGSVNLLFEDPDFLNEPENVGSGTTNSSDYNFLKHIHTKDLPEAFDILEYFRKRLDDYSVSTDNVTRVMITEAYTSIEETMKYYGNVSRKISHFPLNFNLVENLGQESEVFFTAVWSWLNDLPDGAWPNWLTGNDDKGRVATRYGPPLSDALNMISLLLPGTAVTYYGEEIAMEDTDVTFSETRDIWGKMAGPDRFKEVSRDPQRTPFQWNSEKFSGFTNGTSSWLPVNPNFYTVNLQDQKLKNNSHIAIYRNLVKMKKLPAIQNGHMLMVTIGSRVLAFKRFHNQDEHAVVLVVNLGEDQLESINLGYVLDLYGVTLTVSITTENTTYKNGEVVGSDDIRLEPYESVVFTYIYKESSASIFSLSSILIASLVSALYFIQ